MFREKYQHYMGYALSGGGARGFAHLGALKVFEIYGLKPDIIVGTSAGSLAGVFYADGFAPDEIAEIFQKKELKQFFELTIPNSGFFKNTGLEKFLKNNLRSSSFEQLKIPFKAVTTDWINARTAVFSQGKSLAEAVTASCSVPLVFKPVEINGSQYVDGGLLKNFPVSIIRDKCKYIIGVNVSMIKPLSEKINLKTTSERVFNIMSNSNTLNDRKQCDILVEKSGLDNYFMFDLKNIDKIMELGYNAASEALGKEKSLQVINKCHHHYRLEEKVKEKINRIRKMTK